MTRNHERDHEVLQAFVKTSRDLGKKIEISFGHHQIGLSYDEIDTFLAILDALPEPEPAQGDWEECSWLDILHTDKKVKAKYISGTVIEGVPDGVSDDGVFLVDGHVIPYRTGAKWFRIPAPVTHPDPAEHPVILNVATKHNDFYDYAAWDGREYYLCYLRGHYQIGFIPEAINSFTPAKVVADDE